MKKAISIIIVLFLLISISACSSLTPKNIAAILNTATTLSVSTDGYLVYNGTKTKIKVEGLKGKDGINGTNGIDGINGANGINGSNGVDGKDGQAPFIGTNGNWWIGTTDTGVSAAGSGSDFQFRSITLANTIIGAVQKGPFISGTSINFYELDDKYIQTGFAYNTQTINNVGNFELRKGLKLSSTNILFVAQGFYFNEALGETSEVPLTLYLVSDISNESNVNINLMTTLEKERILSLIASGSTYANAVAQARSDVLKIFFLEKTDMVDSQNLDITKAGDDNAILLAISLILQGHQSTSKLSKLISEISMDIRDDGVLDNANLKAQLKLNGLILDYSETKKNLMQFYSDNNIQISVPAFETYVNLFNNRNNYPLISTIEFPILGSQFLGGSNLLHENISYFSGMHKNSTPDLLSVKVKNNKIKIVITPLFDGEMWYSIQDDLMSLNSSAKSMDLVLSNSTYTFYAESWKGETLFNQYLNVYPNETLIEGQDLFRIDLYEFNTGVPSMSKVIKFHYQTCEELYGVGSPNCVQ
jgi:hypothetical protein